MDIVHKESRELIMPKILPNLKETLIETATEIARKEGLSGLKLRDLAKQCHIALGTLYNYYPTKDDLILDVVQQFWQNWFHHHRFPEGDVLVKLDWLYSMMKRSVDEFSSEFLHASSGLSAAALQEAHLREQAAQHHLTQQLAIALSELFPNESEEYIAQRAAFLFHSLLGCLEGKGYTYDSLRQWLSQEILINK